MGGGGAANLGVAAGPSFGAWPSGLVDQVERREKDQAYVGQLPRLECRSVDDTASSSQGTTWLVLIVYSCGLLSLMGRVSRDASGRGIGCILPSLLPGGRARYPGSLTKVGQPRLPRMDCQAPLLDHPAAHLSRLPGTSECRHELCLLAGSGTRGMSAERACCRMGARSRRCPASPWRDGK